MTDLDDFYLDNQIIDTCKQNANGDLNVGKGDSEFDMKCSDKNLNQNITSAQIDTMANNLIDKYKEFKQLWVKYEPLVKNGDEYKAKDLLIKSKILTSSMMKEIDRISDKLYTQSCQMWTNEPKAQALTCNIAKIKGNTYNRHQQKLASIEMKANNIKIYNETLIKIYLSIIINGSMFYLIYKTLKQ